MRERERERERERNITLRRLTNYMATKINVIDLRIIEFPLTNSRARTKQSQVSFLGYEQLHPCFVRVLIKATSLIS